MSSLTRRQQKGHKSQKRGKVAEGLALLWMMMKGYRLVARRVTGKRGSGVGEVDLIVRRGRVLVFMEVKQRQDLATAMESISESQQKRIVRGAERFLQTHPRYRDWDCRFDAIVIVPWRLPLHIMNAWRGW